MSTRLTWIRGAVPVAACLVVVACGGGAAPASVTPSAAPATPSAGPSTSPSIPPSTAPSASAPAGPAADATLNAPQEIEAGKTFEVAWTGPNAKGDYITIVVAGTAKWTDEPYFYTTTGSTGKLTAPSKDGAYALWYVSGVDDAILARRAIRVTPFQGSLLGPDSVQAGSVFEVAWNGPDGPGDYVTIVVQGAAKWTDESYFYTNAGSPSKLVAPIETGAHELWYVIGHDSTVQARRPITVTPYVVTLKAPAQVARGATFEVTWTGPDGPSDYLTIVPAGSAPGTYASYAYTAAGSPSKLTAPTTAGAYEIWYASDRVKKLVFKSIPITVK